MGAKSKKSKEKAVSSLENLVSFESFLFKVIETVDALEKYQQNEISQDMLNDKLKACQKALMADSKLLGLISGLQNDPKMTRQASPDLLKTLTQYLKQENVEIAPPLLAEQLDTQYALRVNTLLLQLLEAGFKKHHDKKKKRRTKGRGSACE